MVKLLGNNNIEYLPDRPGEPKVTLADIKKIKTFLKWNPEIKFEKGVKLMLENINYWKNAPLWDAKKISEATKNWFQYIK